MNLGRVHNDSHIDSFHHSTMFDVPRKDRSALHVFLAILSLMVLILKEKLNRNHTVLRDKSGNVFIGELVGRQHAILLTE